MKSRNRTRLFLESLEDRTCPSLTLRLSGGSLIISGTPQGALSIIESAPSTLQVTDNGLPQGTFRVTGSLMLNLTSHPNTINVDLNGNTFPGSILLYLGTGDPAGNPVSVYSSLPGGTVNGSVYFQGGSGVETWSVGLVDFETTAPVTIRGSLLATGKVSGGGDVGPGDTLFVGPGSTVQGGMVASQMDNVAIGEPGGDLTTVNGGVTIADAGSNAALYAFVFGNIGGDLNVVGTPYDDVFELGPADPGVGGTVTGNLNVYLGTAGSFGDSFTVDAGATVGGSASLIGQGASTPPAFPNYQLAGSFNKSLALNLGQGDNMVAFNDGTVSASVAGNLTIIGGDGANDLSQLTATVAGQLLIQLGNGDNTITVTTPPGGRFTLTLGNGDNTVSLAPDGNNEVWNVNFSFGTGTDTLNLAGAGMNETLVGRIVGHGGTYTLNQGANWSFGSPFTETDFPA